MPHPTIVHNKRQPFVNLKVSEGIHVKKLFSLSSRKKIIYLSTCLGEMPTQSPCPRQMPVAGSLHTKQNLRTLLRLCFEGIMDHHGAFTFLRIRHSYTADRTGPKSKNHESVLQ